MEWFCESVKYIITTENLFNPNDIIVSKLKIGEEVTIGWYPIRYVIVKYEGNYNFKVIDGNDSKMKEKKCLKQLDSKLYFPFVFKIKKLKIWMEKNYLHRRL